MKKGALPELDPKWWATHQPDALATARDLGKALSAYELALDRLAAASTEENHKACEKALEQVETAAKKSAVEAKALLDKPPRQTKSTPDDFQFTAEALEKFPKVLSEARRELAERRAAALTEAGDEDEIADVHALLSDDAAYQRHLRKALQKLETNSMNFAAGFGRLPEEHRFLFHRSKSSKALFATIRQETRLKKLTFGVAGAHGEKPDTLVLALEAPQIPGMKKMTERLLQHFKPLAFAKVVLLVEGSEAEDIADPDDPADDRLAATREPTARQDALAPALEKWRATRNDVVHSLKELAKEIAGAKHPASKNAILELNAVIKNLTTDPDTAQKVAELERWIEQDVVVFDVSDLDEDIRSPLLSALADLEGKVAS